LVTSLTRGLFRFIGGKLSKQDNAVPMQTPSAIIEIRGVAILVDLTADDRLEVIFAYGKGVTITGLNGVSQTITRPGFEVTVSGRGAAPSAPSPAPPGRSAAILSELDGRPGATGGARTIPADVMVANRGIAAEIAGQSQPPPRLRT
jgi:trimeric autotransporter adhesin